MIQLVYDDHVPSDSKEHLAAIFLATAWLQLRLTSAGHAPSPVEREATIAARHVDVPRRW